jgi:Heterokaryon incompatibility protein (HET)
MDSTDAKGKGKSLRKRIAAPFRGLGSRLGSKGESSKSESLSPVSLCSCVLLTPFALSVDLGHDKHIPDFLKRQPDPDWMDIEMMGHWLQKCDAEHGAQCRRPFGMEPSQIGSTSLLIDVRNKCLVDANASSRYACLSYVWGGAKTLKTGKENLGSLKQVNSLEVRRDEIPRTIRDTINLVDQLGIPYLWVDSLCIIQDDAESKHDQIHAMAGIYAGAYVTIIAANGWDADHGLRGIQGVTSPRQLSTFLKSDFEENLQPYSSIWYSRGWTFQEMLFSPRKIMFQYQLAVWECNEAAWHESSLSRMSQPFSVPDHFHPNVSPWQAQIQLSAWPHIRQYIALVRDYSRRKLTYSDDAFPAITSLLSVMSASFSGGFISGLPEMFFDEALLWQPREPMQRRLTSPDRDNPPTWSWAGWEGELTGEAWEEHFNHLLVRRVHFRKWLARGDLTFPVTPTVKWSWG